MLKAIPPRQLLMFKYSGFFHRAVLSILSRSSNVSINIYFVSNVRLDYSRYF